MIDDNLVLLRFNRGILVIDGHPLFIGIEKPYSFCEQDSDPQSGGCLKSKDII